MKFELYGECHPEYVGLFDESYSGVYSGMVLAQTLLQRVSKAAQLATASEQIYLMNVITKLYNKEYEADFLHFYDSLKSFYGDFKSRLDKGQRILFKEGSGSETEFLSNRFLSPDLFDRIVSIDDGSLDDTPIDELSEVQILDEREEQWIDIMKQGLQGVTDANVYVIVGSKHLRPESLISQENISQSLGMNLEVEQYLMDVSQVEKGFLKDCSFVMQLLTRIK